MKAPLDRALFPQSLLRFLATGERMGATPHRMVDMFMQAFHVEGARRGELAQLASRLHSGATLAEVAPKHPGLFPAWLTTLFRFGQKSGRMQEALDWAAEELDREARTARTVAVALAYPAVLILGFLLMCWFCSGYTAGQFRSIMHSLRWSPQTLGEFDRQYPIAGLASRIFMDLGDYWIPLALMVIGWTLVIACALIPKAPGHALVHRAMRWLVPGVHVVDRHARESVMARLLSVGLTAGMPLPELLDEVAERPGDEDQRTLLRDAAARMRMGARPCEAFERATGTTGESFATALATALSGPAPEPVLLRVAAVARARAADDLQRLPHSVGPVYTMMLGALISFLPLAQFAVLFKFTIAVAIH